MNELIEILEKKRDELKKALNGEMPEWGTNEFGRNETRKQWLNWIEHLLLLLKR